ncbi:hypothetical protein HHK36_017282 [Tetracentron sinense]|uniref:Protein N-terminal glutamine amidohydrolase n=1 Tax=Tetracentron sinense TaxID=13715 RepID=A0A834Z2X2_TETSI|nr:hypothetical protein HHK36_017282 [Tetracentron sinense]
MATSSLEFPSSVTPPFDISTFDHTPYYCEENVYLLCNKLCKIGVADAKGSDLFVVFISNEKKQASGTACKASKRADGVVLWDYHVVCVQRKGIGDTPDQVWDLDSSLPFPTPLAHYISETIRPSFQLFPDYHRLCRIVHAPIFLCFFASDRRHMKDSVGNWIEQPPACEPIIAEDGTVHNLDEYIDICAANVVTKFGDDLINAVFSHKLGVVVSENQLADFFSLIS